MARTQVKKKKKKKLKKVEEGKALIYIKSTFNNTVISVTNLNGDVYSWSSGGRIGFIGTRKGTPYAAQLAARNVAGDLFEMGVTGVDIYIKGPGSGKEAAIRALKSEGVEINKVFDITPTPHGGVKRKKS